MFGNAFLVLERRKLGECLTNLVGQPVRKGTSWYALQKLSFEIKNLIGGALARPSTNGAL
jgi:hypothetical protein